MKIWRKSISLGNFLTLLEIYTWAMLESIQFAMLWLDSTRYKESTMSSIRLVSIHSAYQLRMLHFRGEYIQPSGLRRILEIWDLNLKRWELISTGTVSCRPVIQIITNTHRWFSKGCENKDSLIKIIHMSTGTQLIRQSLLMSKLTKMATLGGQVLKSRKRLPASGILTYVNMHLRCLESSIIYLNGPMQSKNLKEGGLARRKATKTKETTLDTTRLHLHTRKWNFS